MSLTRQALLLVAACMAAAGMNSAKADFQMTLLHNNDGESKLLPITVGGQTYAGADRFVTVVNQQKAAAAGSNMLMLSSGDNFLAGAQFNASLQSGAVGSRTFYDALVINNTGYNALALGNHDFDFGPEVLAEFISQVDSSVPYLAANLDFSQEASLQALVNAGRIKKSHVVQYGSEKVGIIGAVTPMLGAISSPGKVQINPVVAAVQAEINALTAQGVNKIVLISHLQDINEELALIPQLSGIDIVIAGGGDELLAKVSNPLIPGDVKVADYPRAVNNLDGVSVPVVTTSGEYKYVGNLQVTFNDAGQVTGINSGGGAIRVSGNPSDADSVSADVNTFNQVTTPVQNFVSGLAAHIVANSQVALNGKRGNILGGGVIDPGVRTQETNFGDLFTDALLWQGKKLANSFGVDAPIVALQNGGGIRNNSILSGNISELNTYDAAAFANFVTVVQDISADRFLQILEHSIARINNGAFGQWAGVRFTYNPEAQAQVTATSGANIGQVLTPGQRIIDVWVMTESGEIQLVNDGVILDPAFTIDLASIDFLVRTNGDAYPFSGLSQINLGVSYQQALLNYLTDPTGLNGVVTADMYPVIGQDNLYAAESGRRIDAVIPEPASMALLALGTALLAMRRRQS